MTEQIARWLAEQIAFRIGVAPDSVDREKPFEEYGLSSLEAVGLSGELEARFACRLEPTALWDHPTVAALAAHAASLAAPALPESEADLDALLLELSSKGEAQ